MKGTKVQKRNILTILFLIIVSALTAGLLAACSTYDAEQSLIDSGYTYTVRYDANGGAFDSSIDTGDEGQEGEDGEEGEETQPEEATDTYIRVKKDSFAIEPGVVYTGAGSSPIMDAPTRTGYTIDHWELVTIDEETGAETTRVWNFETDRVTDNIVLRAIWRRNVYVVITANIDGEDVALYNMSITDPGSILSRLYNTNNGEYVYQDGKFRPDYIVNHFSTFTYNGQTYTPLAFYWMEDGERVELTEENAVYEQSYYDNGQNKTLYADVLEGNFTMVTQAVINNSTLRLNATSNWYLLEDVDFGMSYSGSSYWNALQRFNGNIYGNGHTISNIWVRSQVTNVSSALSSSIFGTMNGVVRDVTFKNVELTVYAGFFNTPTGKNINVALLASEFDDNGQFENVTLEDCKISMVNQIVDGVEKFTYNLPANGTNYWFDVNDLEQTVSGVVTVETKENDAL